VRYARDFTGEFIGAFLLVFFGCGSVAVTVLFSAHTGLFQVALVWGLGVALAIYATRHLSCAHLNPAVSIAMVVGKRMALSRLPVYLAAQFLGAFISAAVLYALFSGFISQYESIHGILRGSPDSVRTAMIFGDFYPHPLSGQTMAITTGAAILAEAVGTFLLVFMVFALTEGCNLGRPDNSLAPFFIGLTIAAIISVIAPLTQAGLNPARDLSPRLFTILAGWGKAALPDSSYGFLTVYVLGPVLGGVLAALAFTRIVEPLLKQEKQDTCNVK
jgi:glycerol uptake facilitator protein